jgi:hypothetical protein
MRKLNPDDFRRLFVSEAGELMDHFTRVSSSLTGSPHEKKDTTQLASTTFLALYVTFERFLSGLFLAYINRDSSSFSPDLANRVLSSVVDRYGQAVVSHTTFTIPNHLSYAELLDLIDPHGWNLTFNDATQIMQRAQSWLAPVHRTRVLSLTNDDCALIDTARSIRDYIAHQSPASRAKMNQMLLTVSAHGGNPHLARAQYEVLSVGAYLKALPVNITRLEIYVDRLTEIAQKL